MNLTGKMVALTREKHGHYAARVGLLPLQSLQTWELLGQTQTNLGFDHLGMNFRVCEVENHHVEWNNYRTKWAVSHRVNALGA